MLDGLFNREPLELRLLVYHHQVDVVAAAEAVVSDGEERVGVGREVDARDAAALRHHYVNQSGSLMAETVVIVAPARGREQDVERSNWAAPLEIRGFLHPLGVLDRLRRRDHGERFVSRIQAVATGEEVALEPTLAQMLAQDLHHPAIRRDVIIDVENSPDETSLLHLEDVSEPIGIGLVRTKKSKIRGVLVFDEDVTHHLPQLSCRLPPDGSRQTDIDGILAEIRNTEGNEKAATIRVRIRPHAAVALRDELRQLW